VRRGESYGAPPLSPLLPLFTNVLEKLFGKSGQALFRASTKGQKGEQKPHLAVFSYLTYSIENSSSYFPNSFGRRILGSPDALSWGRARGPGDNNAGGAVERVTLTQAASVVAVLAVDRFWVPKNEGVRK
jgi:hypothetical protein